MVLPAQSRVHKLKEELSVLSTFCPTVYPRVHVKAFWSFFCRKAPDLVLVDVSLPRFRPAPGGEATEMTVPFSVPRDMSHPC